MLSWDSLSRYVGGEEKKKEKKTGKDRREKRRRRRTDRGSAPKRKENAFGVLQCCVIVLSCIAVAVSHTPVWHSRDQKPAGR